MSWLAVFVGGGLGSLLRWLTTLGMRKWFPGSLPVGTLFSNLISCLLFCVFAWLISRMKLDDSFSLLLLTGICGGYSTFSTFSFETFCLLRTQQYWVAGLNILVNLAGCLLVFILFGKKIAG